MRDGVVVDASALVSLLTPDGRGASVGRAIGRRSLHAPHLVLFEVLHAIRGLELGGRITGVEALEALGDYAVLPLEVIEVDSLVVRIWEVRRNLTASDGSYVALAEHLRVPPVTLDARIARAPGIRCEVIVPS